MLNSVALVGRIVRDPELRFIPVTGTPVSTFTLAVERNYKKKDGTKDTDFIYCEALNAPANFASNYCRKGCLVSIDGAIKVDTYQQDGKNKSITKVSVEKINLLANPKGTSAPSGADGPAFEPPEDGYPAINDDGIPF